MLIKNLVLLITFSVIASFPAVANAHGGEKHSAPKPVAAVKKIPTTPAPEIESEKKRHDETPAEEKHEAVESKKPEESHHKDKVDMAVKAAMEKVEREMESQKPRTVLIIVGIVLMLIGLIVRYRPGAVKE